MTRNKNNIRHLEATVSDCLQMREKYKKDEKVSVYSYSFISSRYRIKI